MKRALSSCVAEGAEGLRRIFDQVKNQSRCVYGYGLSHPAANALELCELFGFEDLPRGVVSNYAPGHASLEKEREDQTCSSFFRHTPGATSPKSIQLPPRRVIWKANRTKEDHQKFQIALASAEQQKSNTLQPNPEILPVAFFGIRSCDLRAMHTLQNVFDVQGQGVPKSAAEMPLLITASCVEPGHNCFCTSFGYGPECQDSDLNITECFVEEEVQHNKGSESALEKTKCEQGKTARKQIFVVDAHTTRGRPIVEALSKDQHLRHASQHETALLTATLKRSQQRLKEFIAARVPNEENRSKVWAGADIAKQLRDQARSKNWETIAESCLSCGNCTMVCPTCFCTTVEDSIDLEAQRSERTQVWDSCFTAGHSYVHGGTVHKSTPSRYRQWMMHKLSSWHDQFGESGCVGCGRCTTWCPVGIDFLASAYQMTKGVE